MVTPENSEVSGVTGVHAPVHAVLVDTSADTVEVAKTSTTKLAISRVPGETDRPCFRVFDDWHTEEATKLKPGVWYFSIKLGRGDAPPTLGQVWVCSPLHIDAVTTDGRAVNYGRQLRFRTTLGKWTTWAMPMMMLRGDCSDLRGELLGMGVEIDPNGRNRLSEYLHRTAPMRQVLCVPQTGWAGTNFKAFVLPNGAIGPKSHDVIYQSGECSNDEYATAGTLNGWQTSIGAMAISNPLLMLGLCAAFAGPVLARCGQESGGIHFIGDSSTGKTTIIEAACSVWGGPGFKRSWRTTGNGLEGAAAMFNDSLLALDEISQCDPAQVGEVVYMLSNGRGKQRASRTGSARAVPRWRTSVLSTGERSIETTMAEGGDRIKAGQAVRLFDVPAKRVYGAWDDLHSFASGTAFSDGIKRAAETDYGHAGRSFLEKLTRDHETNFSEALDLMKAMPEFNVPNDEGQTKRAAARFAILALSGELATSYGVTGWPEGEAIEAAAVGFAAWQERRGLGLGNAEHNQITASLRSFIELHGDSRFSNADRYDEQREAMVRDRAGWWRTSGDGRLYLFTATGFREALKGFDFARALDSLEKAGAIDAAGVDGKRAKPQRIHGRSERVYAVKPDQLEDNIR